MRTLKQIIGRFMRMTAFILVCVILITTACIQINLEKSRAYESGIRTLSQIEQLLTENEKELAEITETYKETCLHNAEVIDRIIDRHPEILNDVDELREIAKMVEVDEIHFFTPEGCIYAGTHPEYYGYTFDSGEQMHFFKPLLDNKSLQLVQDITPNTAEGKFMQYSALWSKSGELIVQIGMEPVSVMKVTEKNQLSYIFSLFRVNPEASYYAIDADTQEIIGSTAPELVGRPASEVGLAFSDLSKQKNGFLATVSGQRSFCVFKESGGRYIGRVIPQRDLYQRVPSSLAQLAICLTVVVIILIYGVTRYMNQYVVNGIRNVNDKLNRIAKGNLNERVDVNTSVEFLRLSQYINSMVKSLLDDDKRMSNVLSRTNLPIGVFQYNRQSGALTYTDDLPMLLCLDATEMRQMDAAVFRAFISNIYTHPVQDEEKIYELSVEPARYIKLEELDEGEKTLGVVIDVTDDVRRRKAMEFERDNDCLTGLYNRRGLDRRLTALFAEPEKLGHSALVMIDADGLKRINDQYGHEMGDLYLKGIADILQNFAPGKSVAARQSGDEFILFLYQYPSRAELMEALHAFETIRDHSSVTLSDDLRVPLEFSLGYCLTGENADYLSLIKQADSKMYSDKRERKAKL